MPEQENIFIQRRPLFKAGYCAPAAVESIILAFGIDNYRQEDIYKYISIPDWGTQPKEIVSMFEKVIPKNHIFAKTNWIFEDLEEILLCPERVGVIVDIQDKLSRISKTTGVRVPEENVDGHYLDIAGIVKIQERKYAICIDGSKDEIVQQESGVIILSENIYLVEQSLFEGMWEDTNIDNTLNNRWGCVVVHPDDNPMILDKYRVK